MFFRPILRLVIIEIDEKGAEAAAATAEEMTFGDDSGESTYSFTVDHPFIFMIVEQSTGAAIFMGRVTDL